MKPSTAGRILIVEDDETMATLMREMLADSGYTAESIDNGEAALQMISRELYDVVLLDLVLPGMGGLNVLSAAPALQTDSQFVVTTAHGKVESAVEAMRLGAYDFLTKPFRPEELLRIIERALQDRELRRSSAQAPHHATGRGFETAIVGDSPPMLRLFALIERVAVTRATVLLHGETGTGKELVARLIHELSPRARRPFVPVNCSALPEGLLESELFGHVKGSFTGAIASRRGWFEEADGGTLLLDEISTISATTQVKLLRVLQDHRIQRVGGTPLNVDFRLIAASNVDLAEEVAEGRFREDLFYRLNVFPVRVPPLRERRSDIPQLADHFRRRYAEENQVDAPEIMPDTMRRLMAYEWPGNVRELENFIERSVILHAGARFLPFEPPVTGSRSSAARQLQLVDRARAERWSVQRLEREYILNVLEDTHGNRGNAAEILQIDRRTLYRKLKQYEDQDGLPQVCYAD